jgi:hypothetical protein
MPWYDDVLEKMKREQLSSEELSDSFETLLSDAEDMIDRVTGMKMRLEDLYTYVKYHVEQGQSFSKKDYDELINDLQYYINTIGKASELLNP